MKTSFQKKLLITTLIFCGAMTMSGLTTSAQTMTDPFTDITEGNSHFVAVNFLKNLELVQGYDDGTFKPDREINRAEALKILMTAVKGTETKNPKILNFADVNKSDWFYPFILSAWNNYLVNGYPDKLFHPEKPINLAESLKILLIQEGSDIPQSIATPPYTDVAVTAWYAPYASIAKERTLFLESRSNGALNAGQTMTRGSFVELIYRLLRSGEGSRFARATWYADLLANQSTASGEQYEPNHFTVAHKTLPFGTKLLVTNMENGKSVEVTVNDRGPYATGVDLDLSKSAFGAIANTGEGIIFTEYRDITNEPSTQQTTQVTQQTQPTTQTLQSTQQTQPVDIYGF